MDNFTEQVFDAGLVCSESTLRFRLAEVTNDINDRSARLLDSIGSSDELEEEVGDLLMEKLAETPEYHALIERRDELLREYLIGKLTA